MDEVQIYSTGKVSIDPSFNITQTNYENDESKVDVFCFKKKLFKFLTSNCL